MQSHSLEGRNKARANGHRFRSAGRPGPSAPKTRWRALSQQRRARSARPFFRPVRLRQRRDLHGVVRHERRLPEVGLRGRAAIGGASRSRRGVPRGYSEGPDAPSWLSAEREGAEVVAAAGGGVGGASRSRRGVPRGYTEGSDAPSWLSAEWEGAEVVAAAGGDVEGASRPRRGVPRGYSEGGGSRPRRGVPRGYSEA